MASPPQGLLSTLMEDSMTPAKKPNNPAAPPSKAAAKKPLVRAPSSEKKKKAKMKKKGRKWFIIFLCYCKASLLCSKCKKCMCSMLDIVKNMKWWIKEKWSNIRLFLFFKENLITVWILQVLQFYKKTRSGCLIVTSLQF